MWVIKLKHKKNGNIFYLSGVRVVDGISCPVGCMKYRASKAALLFPSLGSALAVVKACSPCDWLFRVRPANCLKHPLTW